MDGISLEIQNLILDQNQIGGTSQNIQKSKVDFDAKNSNLLFSNLQDKEEIHTATDMHGILAEKHVM